MGINICIYSNHNDTGVGGENVSTGHLVYNFQIMPLQFFVGFIRKAMYDHVGPITRSRSKVVASICHHCRFNAGITGILAF